MYFFLQNLDHFEPQGQVRKSIYLFIKHAGFESGSGELTSDLQHCVVRYLVYTVQYLPVPSIILATVNTVDK